AAIAVDRDARRGADGERRDSGRIIAFVRTSDEMVDLAESVNDLGGAGDEGNDARQYVSVEQLGQRHHEFGIYRAQDTVAHFLTCCRSVDPRPARAWIEQPHVWDSEGQEVVDSILHTLECVFLRKNLDADEWWLREDLLEGTRF